MTLNRLSYRATARDLGQVTLTSFCCFRLGYRTKSQSGHRLSEDSKITYQHKIERSMPCETAKDGIKALLKFFSDCLQPYPGSDGILLVLLHSEHLMDLMREIWLLKNKRYLEKFSVVKGVCFVEEIVR